MSSSTVLHSFGLLSGSSNVITGGYFNHIQACDCRNHVIQNGWDRLFQGVDQKAFHNSTVREAIFEDLPAQYTEVVQRVVGWAGASRTPEHALWLHGSSCTSSISQSIADIQEQEHLLFATYFVSEDPQNEDVRARFISTIAYQLGLFFPEVREKLGNILAHDPSILSRSVSYQLDSLLLQPLAPLLSDVPDDARNGENPSIVIIVDGCDSLDHFTHSCIINALFKFARHFPFRVRILLSTKLSTGISQNLTAGVKDGSVMEIPLNAEPSQIGDQAGYSFLLLLGVILQVVWDRVKMFARINGRI